MYYHSYFPGFQLEGVTKLGFEATSAVSTAHYIIRIPKDDGGFDLWY